MFRLPLQSQLLFDDKMRHYALLKGRRTPSQMKGFIIVLLKAKLRNEFLWVSQSRTWIFCPGFSIIGFSNLSSVLSFPASQSYCCLLLGFPDSTSGAAIPTPFRSLQFTATMDSHITACPQSMLSHSRVTQWAAQLGNV